MKEKETVGSHDRLYTEIFLSTGAVQGVEQKQVYSIIPLQICFHNQNVLCAVVSHYCIPIFAYPLYTVDKSTATHRLTDKSFKNVHSLKRNIKNKINKMSKSRRGASDHQVYGDPTAFLIKLWPTEPGKAQWK